MKLLTNVFFTKYPLARRCRRFNINWSNYTQCRLWLHSLFSCFGWVTGNIGGAMTKLEYSCNCEPSMNINDPRECTIVVCMWKVQFYGKWSRSNGCNTYMFCIHVVNSGISGVVRTLYINICILLRTVSKMGSRRSSLTCPLTPERGTRESRHVRPSGPNRVSSQ